MEKEWKECKDLKEWKDCGTFWEHTAPQGSEKWKEARIGRVNSSNSGAMGDKNQFKSNKSGFKKAEETGRIIAGVEKEEFTEEALLRMEHGKKTEPIVREWYEKTNNYKVLERGLCVLKNDITIGASVDGDVLNTNGIIEIKCPVKMYHPLLTYMENIEHGWKPEKGYHDHIWDTHYAQTQHGMFVLNKQWCEYIVYCSASSQVFTQRIEFDMEYWKQHYFVIKNNYNKYVYPYLKKGYSIIPL